MSTALSQVLAYLDRLLKLAEENSATEVRIAAGMAPVLRIDGQARAIKAKPIPPDEFAMLLEALVPRGGGAGKFSFSSVLGPTVGQVIDVQGTQVLLVHKDAAAEAAAPASLPSSFELDIQEAPKEKTAAPIPVATDEPKVVTGVSDIHITVGLPPVFRQDGHMRPQQTKVLTGDDTNGLMKSITPERCQAELAEKGGTDFGFAFKDLARFRVSVFKQRGTVAMVLRQIPTKLLTPEQLGLPDVCKRMVTRPRGLFLVTGPTGSGKSTSLAGLIDFINANYEHHIITIEDPIEFYHYSKKSTVNQREIGTDVPSFAEALRRALRQDPDVILVGELRDLETIEAAISAAETGHVVFGTLHTTGAQGTVNRIIDAFPTNQQEQVRTQLSTAIIGVLSQTLLPKIGGGRCAAYEVLVVTPAIGNLIRENKTFRINSAIQTGAKLGMQLLDDHLFKHWLEKRVTEENVLAKAQNVDDLASRIAKAKAGEIEDDEVRAKKAARELAH
jgi:twitching motility protein PilT